MDNSRHRTGFERRSLSRAHKSLPKITGADPLRRQDRGVPGLDAVHEEAVGETTPAAVGYLLDGDCAELRVPAVDVPDVFGQ